MNEQKIHSLIRTGLQTQYEREKQKWLDKLGFPTFDFDWTPDWGYIRCEVSIDLMRNNDVEDFLYEEYGDDYNVVLDGHVFQVWEVMRDEFGQDLENTKIDLVHDKKNRESESKCVYPR